jgi:hypothetical protein
VSLGCVVRVESTEQDLRRVGKTSHAGGCYLGIIHVRCLWREHVTGRGLGVECLRGMKPGMGGAVMARGVGCSVERKTVSPCEDVLLSHPKD